MSDCAIPDEQYQPRQLKIYLDTMNGRYGGTDNLQIIDTTEWTDADMECWQCMTALQRLSYGKDDKELQRVKLSRMAPDLWMRVWNAE